MSSVLDLPFDQYQRYRLVSSLLNELRGKQGSLSILDVGGRTALLRPFLPKDRVTLVDVEASGEPGLVLGDGAALPFQDASFDVVCAFDTLEHVPPALRTRFLSECYRVTRRYVVLAGPYQAPAVEEAEILLQRFLKDKLAVEHRYLEEHRHNGLPDRAATEQVFVSLGAQVQSIGHGNVQRWLGLICLSMYLDYTPALQDLAVRLSRFYNAGLFEDDAIEPVYRHAVVAAKAGAPLPAARLPKLPAAQRVDTAALNNFARELAAFDAHRDGYQREWQRLQSVVAGLEKDLSEHKLALAELEQRKSELEAVQATLSEDLRGHRASIADLRAELERFPAEIAAFQHSVATLEADLEQHKRVIAAREAALAALDLERENLLALRASDQQAAQAVQAALQSDLQEHRAALATLQADLEQHRASLAAERSLRADQSQAAELAIADRERRIGEYAQTVQSLESELAATRADRELIQRAAQALELERAKLEQLLAQTQAAAQAQVREWEAQLGAHRALTERQAQELAAQARELETRQNLLKELRAAHTQALAQAQAEREAQGLVIHTLEADLHGHRAALSATRQELEALRAEYGRVLEDREALRADRERWIQQHQEQQARLQQASLELAQADALIGRLRAELRNRWQSLQRALGPKRPTPGES